MKNLDLSNFQPSWNAVVVEQDVVEAKKGNIFLPDSTKEADEHARLTGTVKAIGELAFTFGTPGKDDFIRLRDAPKVSDRVVFKRYAGGTMLDGPDGEKYRIIDHTDVIGVLK